MFALRIREFELCIFKCVHDSEHADGMHDTKSPHVINPVDSIPTDKIPDNETSKLLNSDKNPHFC